MSDPEAMYAKRLLAKMHDRIVSLARSEKPSTVVQLRNKDLSTIEWLMELVEAHEEEEENR